MASVYPAEAMVIAARKGRRVTGAEADFVLLTPTELELKSSIAGRKVFDANAPGVI